MMMKNKSLGRCYLDGWRKCSSYKGKATRKEFWSFIILNTLLILFIGGLSYFWLVNIIADNTSRGGMALIWSYFVFLPLTTLLPLILLLPILSLGVRRMHDIGKSGWWFGGVLLANIIVIPVILTAIYHFLTKSLNDDVAQMVATTINSILSFVSIVILLWLCCKPTQQQESVIPSTTDKLK